MLADASNNLILSDGSIIAAGWSAGSTPICYTLDKKKYTYGFSPGDVTFWRMWVDDNGRAHYEPWTQEDHDHFNVAH